MGLFRKLFCATAFLDMVLSALSILCKVSIAKITLRQAFRNETWTLVLICFFMWVKAIIAYYTLKSCIDMISTTLRSCECYSLMEKNKIATRWRNVNVANQYLSDKSPGPGKTWRHVQQIPAPGASNYVPAREESSLSDPRHLGTVANLILSSPVVAFIVLIFLLPKDYYCFIVSLAPIEFPLCVYITVISCLHARKMSMRMDVDLEHSNTQNASKVKPNLMHKRCTCYFAFVETVLNGVKVMLFGLTVLYFVLSGVSANENSYKKILQVIIDVSLGFHTQLPWYTLGAICTVLYFLVPLACLYFAIRTVSVTIHVCPEISLPTLFARMSHFRNWTCFVLLLNAVNFTVLIVLGSKYLAIALLVIEFVVRFGFLIKLWFHVNETKAYVENAQ